MRGFPSQVKGAGPPNRGGVKLKIAKLTWPDKKSCGVEPARHASLQGFESPSPHHFTGTYNKPFRAPFRGFFMGERFETSMFLYANIDIPGTVPTGGT